MQTNCSEIFRAHKSKALAWRLSTAAERQERLRRLRDSLFANEERILQATAQDFGKPATETLLSELLLVHHEINCALRSVDEWMRPKAVPSGLLLFGASSEIRHEPRGVALIISPWNYPWQLALCPLVAALAAGNTVMLKPSELTPNCSKILQDLLHETFARDEVSVWLGDKEISQELLTLPVDHIFFTGSTAVGHIVMAAAAKTLASVTLELGGKSPAIVHKSADLDWAAERLLWGKWINAGQTCVAPDTIFVDQSCWPELQKHLARHAQRFAAKFEKDFSQIVSPAHWQRMRTLSDEAGNRGWHLQSAIGSASEKERRWPLQIFEMRDASLAATSGLAREEIFGPLMPVILFTDLESVLDRLDREEKPLALYLFARDRKVQERVLKRTTSGGVVINDVLSHLANPELPFGGVGPSGQGSYHGEHGFRAFSHAKAVLRQSRLRAVLRFFEPPYSSSQEKWLRRLLRLGL